MKYRTLGRTGLVVSEIGFGSWAIGGSTSAEDERAVLNTIATTIEMGCNFFDTADVYAQGQSEEILGRGLQQIGKLNDAIIATKVGSSRQGGRTVVDFSEEYIRAGLEQSLKRLGRDHVELYQLHNPHYRLIEDGQIFDTMEKLQKEGKIRHYGVSIHSVPEGLAALKNGRPATLQLVYNLYSLIQSEDPTEELFPQAREYNIGVIAREPLANGFLTGKQKLDTQYPEGDIRNSWPSNYRSYRIRLADALRFLEKPGRTMAQAALRFALDEPAIATTTVGVKTPQQARENFAVSDMPPLNEADRKAINNVFFG